MSTGEPLGGPEAKMVEPTPVSPATAEQFNQIIAELRAKEHRLEAEIRAWRERFPTLYYRSMDDCIERTLNS